MKELIELFLLIYIVGHPNVGVSVPTPIPTMITQPQYEKVKSMSVKPSPMTLLVNNERISRGMKPLIETLALNLSASMKCQDMIDRDYWSHFAPDGTSPWDFFDKAKGGDYRHAGENLARDYVRDEDAFNALMHSPTHRDNILSEDYTRIGIGKCQGDLGGINSIVIVQHFASIW